MSKLTTIVALATIMLLAATAPSLAQNEPTVKLSRWSIGPKAGMNLTHLWGSDFNNDNARMRPAGQFGVFTTWSNDSWFAVSGELLYSAKGSRFRNPNPFGDVVGVWRMDYIEMPILFRFFLARQGAIRPHLSMGPSWGVMVLARSKVLEPIKVGATSFYDNSNKFDVGLNFGGGVNIRISEGIWLTPELRYNLGLLNTAPNANVRNGALTFSVGVGFPIGSNQ
jgi:opacity protein-like surface antigen